MMRTLKISTYLASDLETVKSYLMTPALLNYVVAGLMKFHPIEPNFFPSKWVEGKFSVKMFAFHFLPIGKQIVGIEFPQKSDHWVLRDNGSGSIAKTWDHLIFLESEEAELDIQMRFLSMLVFSHYQSISTHSFFTPIDKCDGGN